MEGVIRDEGDLGNGDLMVVLACGVGDGIESSGPWWSLAGGITVVDTRSEG